MDLDTLITIGTALAGWLGLKKRDNAVAATWSRVAGLVEATVAQVLSAAKHSGRVIGNDDLDRWARLMRAGLSAAGLRVSDATWRRAVDLARDRMVAAQIRAYDELALPALDRLGDTLKKLDEHRRAGVPR